MRRSSRALLPALLVLPLLAACGSENTDLPPGLGPVAPVTDVAMPTACETGTGPGALVIGPARAVIASPSYTERQARGCVPYSLAQVWQALQGATGVDVSFWPEHTETDCEAWLLPGTEYPVSFVTKEIPHGGIEKFYTFEITWRGGVTQGTGSAPQEVKVLYGKTAGTVEVPKILGSMVFTQDLVRPGWTHVDLVRQVNTNGHSDEPVKLTNWLQGYFDGLQTQLSTGTLQPRYCNLQ